MIKIKHFLPVLAVIGMLALFSTSVFAHGYVISPASRNYKGSLDKNTLGYTAAVAKYGAIINEPQSLEAPKGFPQIGSAPADGRIASANGAVGGDFTLDRQSATMWTKTDISTGMNAFVWKYTAYHSTAKWHYYITKQGWDPNQPLKRSDLELIGEVQGNGVIPKDNDPHHINIPANRSGYHVVLAVWDIFDTINAFYNAIDVNITPGGGTVTAPNAPTGLTAIGITSSSAKLSWVPQTGASSYLVYRNEQFVKEVNTAEFQDQGLSPNTSYIYKVEAKGNTGLVSPKSAGFTVKTTEITAVERPTVPGNLHVMGATENSVSLMWGASTHSQGIKRYELFQNGVKLVETVAPNFTSNGLTEDTEYTYTVKAISLDDQVSDASNEVKVRTAKKTSGKPTAPVNLHAMAVTENTVSLMWGASSHTQGIKVYQVFQNGALIGETAQTSFSKAGLSADTEYTYTVKAVSQDDQVSDASSSLVVRTRKTDTNTGQLYCGTPVYDATKAYSVAKTKVFFNCRIWENKWYANPNEVPGVNMVWDEVSICTESPECKDNAPVTYCGVQPFNATKAYDKAKTQVFYDCKIWENQWYANVGETPGQSSTWKFVSNCTEGPGCNVAKTAGIEGPGSSLMVVKNNLIGFAGGDLEKVSEVNVYDIQGVKLLTFKNARKNNMDISSLRPGMYIIKTIYTDGSSSVTKTVKK